MGAYLNSDRLHGRQICALRVQRAGRPSAADFGGGADLFRNFNRSDSRGHLSANGQAETAPTAQVEKQGTAEAQAATTVVASDQSTPATAPPVRAAEPVPSLFSSLLMLLGIGLVSPFLALKEGMGGLLTLLIIFFGLQRAWHLTGRTNVLVMGPYQLGS